ncbi:MAG: peptidase [Phycisphaerae bacterium]|nr:peptidase [Phycisphaerae bacterium]
MDSSRRTFFRTASAIGAGMAAAALLGRNAHGALLGAPPPTAPGKGSGATGAGAPPAADSSSGADVFTGSGEHRYRVHHDWLTPPNGYAFGDTHGLAQDSAGRIYVAHTVNPSSESKDAVLVFNRDGSFARSFGSEFAGGAHGLDLRAESGTEYLYHCDTGRRCVVKTALDGTVVWKVGAPMESGAYEKAEQWCPTNVAFGPDGMLFVGDGYGAGFVHVYDAAGNWKRIVSRPGKDIGQTSCPHGMTVDTRGTAFTKEPTLCVADRGNRRMQYFALDGKPLGVVTAGMRMPCDMKVRGELLLVPDLESVVTILDGANTPVAHLGDGNPTNLRGAPRDKFVPGKFVHPHDAIWLDDGSILVAEWVPIGRVTRLVRATA